VVGGHKLEVHGAILTEERRCGESKGPGRNRASVLSPKGAGSPYFRGQNRKLTKSAMQTCEGPEVSYD